MTDAQAQAVTTAIDELIMAKLMWLARTDPLPVASKVLEQIETARAALIEALKGD